MTRLELRPGAVVLILGEVHTGLLRHSTAVSQAVAERILALRLGAEVRSSKRPVPYTVSPDLFDGVDCRLPTSNGGQPRGIGTVASYASITGGQIVQATSVATLTAGTAGRRRPWGHYLARPGVIETLGPANWDHVAAGWAASERSVPNLAAIAVRHLAEVQESSLLDQTVTIRTPVTRLRWMLEYSESGSEIELSVESGEDRTIRMSGAGLPARAVSDLCGAVAMHDWLLTIVLTAIDRSHLDSGINSRVLGRLRPAIDRFLHLWMPAARIDAALRPYWVSLDEAAGLTEQWRTQVARIRDQLALHTVGLLEEASDRAQQTSDAG
ncbi:SCO2521 family protein [Cryptosporangium sp. NPDC051539]|uniref:SCO2521 family protein n=1 Tax=Cryptosporangium sp. NPDC051539 TaxID=3363962 RepID=UPI0037B40568